MSPKNVQDLVRWYLTGAALWTAYLTEHADGFAPSRSGRGEIATAPSLTSPFAKERYILSPDYCSLYQHQACDVTPLTRRMSLAIDKENAVDAEIDDELKPTNIYT